MKRMRRRTRNRIIGVSSTLVILLLGVVLVTGINKADSSIQKQLLGEAYNYGIVADKITQLFHFNSNFATNEYSYDTVFQTPEELAPTVGAGILGDEKGLEVIATKVGKHLWVNGSDGKLPTVKTEETDLNKFKFKSSESDYFHKMKVEQATEKDKLKNKVTKMISDVEDKSVELAKKLSVEGKDYVISNYSKWDGQVKIEIKTDDPVIYVDATRFITNNSDPANSGAKKTKRIFIKRKNKNQTIVFNYVYYSKYAEESTENEEPVSVNSGSDSSQNESGQQPSGDVAPAANNGENPEEPSKESNTQADVNVPANNDSPEVESKQEGPKEQPGQEEPEEQPGQEDDETVSLFGGPSVAKAAVISGNEIDVDKSKKLNIDIEQIYFLDDSDDSVTFNYAPKEANDVEKTLDLAEHIVVNMPYANHVVITESIGTFVAPNARGKFGNGLCFGWLVMNEVYANCNEWHTARRKPTPSPSPSASPSSSPSASPSSSPSASPSSSPSASPSSSPSASPSSSPSASPSPSPSASPSSSPSASPSPSPSASPSPSPSASPSPSPSASPSPSPSASPSPSPSVSPSPSPTTTPPSTTTPPVVTPPSTTTPPVIFYTFTPAPTETPVTIVEEEVPLSDAGPDEVPDEEEKYTLIPEDVPLAATVPETGDTMNPMIPIAGMGLSVLALVGVVVIRKKKLNK